MFLSPNVLRGILLGYSYIGMPKLRDIPAYEHHPARLQNRDENGLLYQYHGSWSSLPRFPHDENIKGAASHVMVPTRDSVHRWTRENKSLRHFSQWLPLEHSVQYGVLVEGSRRM